MKGFLASWAIQWALDLHPKSALINTIEINVAVHNIHY